MEADFQRTCKNFAEFHLNLTRIAQDILGQIGGSSRPTACKTSPLQDPKSINSRGGALQFKCWGRVSSYEYYFSKWLVSLEPQVEIFRYCFQICSFHFWQPFSHVLRRCSELP